MRQCMQISQVGRTHLLSHTTTLPRVLDIPGNMPTLHRSTTFPCSMVVGGTPASVRKESQTWVPPKLPRWIVIVFLSLCLSLSLSPRLSLPFSFSLPTFSLYLSLPLPHNAQAECGQNLRGEVLGFPSTTYTTSRRGVLNCLLNLGQTSA